MQFQEQLESKHLLSFLISFVKFLYLRKSKRLHFARVLKEKKDQFVKFFECRHFIDVLNTMAKTDSSWPSLQLIADILEKCCQKDYFDFDPFMKDRTCNLILDGFDEIKPSQFQFAQRVLACIKEKWECVRIWITTRPEYLRRVEQICVVLGFYVQPFQREDKLLFLRKYWAVDENNTVHCDKLNNFSEECLSALDKQTTTLDQQVTGIPLLCLMSAQVFEDEAIDFIFSPVSNVTALLASLVTIYDKFMEVQYLKTRVKYENEIKNVYLTDEYLLKLHTKLALDLLFPESSSTFYNFDPDESFYTLNTGIVEPLKDANPRFINLTFAEYFVAKWVVSMLATNFKTIRDNEHLTSEIFQTIFDVLTVVFDTNISELPLHRKSSSYRFKFATVCYFVNATLRSRDDINFIQNTVTVKEEHIPTFELWFHAAVQSNLLETVKLVNLLYPISVKKICFYDKKEAQVSVIKNSILSKNEKILQIVLNLLEECWSMEERCLLSKRFQQWKIGCEFTPWNPVILHYYKQMQMCPLTVSILKDDLFFEHLVLFTKHPNEIEIDMEHPWMQDDLAFMKNECMLALLLAGYAVTMNSFMLFQLLFAKYDLARRVREDIDCAKFLLVNILKNQILNNSDIEERQQMIKFVLKINKYSANSLLEDKILVHLNLHPELAILFCREVSEVNRHVQVDIFLLSNSINSSTFLGEHGPSYFHDLLEIICKNGYQFNDLSVAVCGNATNLLHRIIQHINDIYDDTLQLLTEIGADVNGIDDCGHSALQIAKKFTSHRVVNKLVALGAVDRYLTLNRFTYVLDVFRK